MVVAASALVAAVPARAQGEIAASAYQRADATWLVRRPGAGLVMYFVTGLRFSGAEGTRTFALVGKADCREFHDRAARIIFCVGSARLRKIPARDFRLHPLLSSSSLVVRADGHVHTISWEGEGSPGPAVRLPSISLAVRTGGGVMRRASAGGRLFGRTVAPSEPALLDGTLGEGVDAATADVGAGTLVTVRRAFAVP